MTPSKEIEHPSSIPNTELHDLRIALTRAKAENARLEQRAIDAESRIISRVKINPSLRKRMQRAIDAESRIISRVTKVVVPVGIRQCDGGYSIGRCTCGKSVGDFDKYCPHCGAKIKWKEVGI